jgi:hypothetical protein
MENSLYEGVKYMSLFMACVTPKRSKARLLLVSSKYRASKKNYGGPKEMMKY